MDLTDKQSAVLVTVEQISKINISAGCGSEETMIQVFNTTFPRLLQVLLLFLHGETKSQENNAIETWDVLSDYM